MMSGFSAARKLDAADNFLFAVSNFLKNGIFGNLLRPACSGVGSHR
jgi:hypothetical protein